MLHALRLQIFALKITFGLQEGSSVLPIFKASYEKELAGHVEVPRFWQGIQKALSTLTNK
jgi:hypothetical protein